MSHGIGKSVQSQVLTYRVTKSEIIALSHEDTNQTS